MFPVDNFFRTVQRAPDSIAVIDGARTLSYADLAQKVNALASAYQAIDPKPQSRVAVFAYNTLSHLIAWLATLAAGKTWVALNPRNGNEELQRILAVTEPSILHADGDCIDRLDPQGATVILGQEEGATRKPERTMTGLIAAHAGQAPARHPFGLDDLQAIKFTGGSSGIPKGVMQTYRVWNACIASMVASFEFDALDRHLLAAPMTHGVGTLMMPIFARGGTQVFLGPPKPAAILDAIERHRITTVYLPPTVVYMMLAEPGLAARDLTSLRHAIVGGAAIRPDVVRTAMPIFNHALETCYGQTEAPQIAICMRAHDWRDERNLASTGRATLLTQVEVMDGEGRLLPPGETGEIVLKGDLVMKGYFKMPEETARTIVDGWLHTGDVGAIDDCGFVFIKDRIRDVIITGGFNVYPSDVEAVLGSHPAVRECVVFGAPDAKWGEAVQAAVELHDGAEADEAALIAYVKRRLDSVKAPKRVHFADHLPRSPVGKVLRRKAKAMFIS